MPRRSGRRRRPRARGAVAAAAISLVLLALPVTAGAVVARRAAALYETPAVAPDPASEPVSVGGLPGWVRPGGDGTRWAVLLPGLGSHPLRHQDIATDLVERGTTVLFAAHSARWPARRHRFGLHEQHEALAWLRFAADRGATEVVLFGWSFGASLWLRVLADADTGAPLPVRVRAVVLTGPLSDWDDAVAHGLGGGVLGRIVAAAARWTLRVPLLVRLAGQSRALRTDRPPLPAGHPVPRLLVVHGDADRTVPLASSRRLADEWPGAATLLVVPGAGHGAERDTDAAGWLDAVHSAV